MTYEEEHPKIANILFGSFIRYERLYEMTKYAFYGDTDSNDVNIFIDAYSILKSLYGRGLGLQVDDSCVIASCLINLAIHLRAYFETRHRVSSKVYIVYGGARPMNSFVNYPQYNSKNIVMEDSNFYLKSLIKDNLDIVDLLSKYLHDIFCIIDYNAEFNCIVSGLIQIDNKDGRVPNIIYSKDPLSYQLVAFEKRTFLYRPKKKVSEDVSWVVTKSTLYDAYRYGELGLTKQLPCSLDVRMFSIYQAISGVKSRSMNSIKNANSTVTLLEKAVVDGTFNNGYNSGAIFNSIINPFEKMFQNTSVDPALITNRFAAIDLQFQTLLFSFSYNGMNLGENIINLYNPQEVRNINDRYFQKYPLDLNRV